MPSEHVELLQGSLDLIVLRALQTMGPLHAYSLATRLEQVSDHPLRPDCAYCPQIAGCKGQLPFPMSGP
jgi:hypothetical protein